MTKVSQLLPLTDAMGLFKAFAEPVRLRLLALLADGRELCVCHLYEALEIPQPTVSRHLAFLRKRMGRGAERGALGLLPVSQAKVEPAQAPHFLH